MKTENNKNSMTANGLISQALGLQASHYALNGKSKEVRLDNSDRKELILTGLAQSSSILLSFAIEIALKGLLKYRFNDFPRIHDLKKLYNKLDEDDRTEISSIFKEKTNSDIDKCLQRHKDMFIEFRYLEQESDEPYNSKHVNDALNSIIEYYNHIKTID